MKNFNVIMNSERDVRFKPTNGYHKKNDGVVTQYNPPHIGTKDTYRMGILAIPKNASSSIRNMIWMTSYNTKQKWSDPAHFIDLAEHWNNLDDIIVILRNPYERFMSAINMFLTTRQWEGGIMKSNGDQTEITLLNEHVYSQSYYLEDILGAGSDVTDKLRYFYMSNTDDVTEDIAKCFPQLVRPEDSHLNTANKSVTVVTGVNKEMIRSMYKQDFNLIENTEFMNSEKISFNKGE